TEGPVDLLAQVADVHVDHVRPALERHVPGAVEQLPAAQDRSRPAHEELEQRELLRRELELRLAAPRTMGRRVEAQVADLEHRRTLDRRAASQRAQPGEQLLEEE